MDEQIKIAFKAEVAKNGTDMSNVTEALWKSYILMSIEKRKQRYAQYAVEKTTSNIEKDE